MKAEDSQVNGKRLMKFTRKALSFFTDEETLSSIMDDLSYRYDTLKKDKGIPAAVMRHCALCLMLFVPFLLQSVLGGFAMLKNYLKTTFRHLCKQKVFSLINIIGLTIGLACSILIWLYVFHELSFDRFHVKADQIYRIAVHGKIIDVDIDQVSTPAPLAGTLLAQCPEVEQAVRIGGRREDVVSYQGQSFRESDVIAADADFFDLFTFPLEKGNPKTALAEPNTVVITREVAEKYFGSKDPFNKILTISNNDYVITGILKDIPENSHIRFRFLLSMSSIDIAQSTEWANNYFSTYVLLRPGYTSQQLEVKLADLSQKHVTSVYQSFVEWQYYLEPLKKIHLYSKVSQSYNVQGDILYIYIFSVIAFFILLIAGINFINLSSAQSLVRAKEIGVRKVLGSNRVMLVKQFLLESILISIAATVLAVLLVHLCLPFYRKLVGREIRMDYFSDPWILLVLAGLSVSVGILAGSFPAFFLSSFKPVTAIKERLKRGRKGPILRNSLVVFQFAISIFLISGTFVIFNQLKYVRSTKLGFNKEQLVVIQNPDLLEGNRTAFREKLRQHSQVVSLSYASGLPGTGYFPNQQVVPEDHERLHFDLVWGDSDYLETLQIGLSQGRFFSKEYSTDTDSIVINEAAAAQMGWDEPLGKKIQLGSRILHVIGVVKDFHYKSFHTKIDKLGILFIPEPYLRRTYRLAVRINTVDIQGTLEFIQKTWDSFSPPLLVEYAFLDESFDRLYRSEMLMGRIAVLFSSLAILISCLGLLALAAFSAQQRTKEIGIRKVLGASDSGIFFLLFKHFIKLVLFANIIAWPLVYLIMNKWLQNFAYRVDVGIWTFLIPGVFTALVTILTSCGQSIKAATANPIDSLRYE